MSRSPLGGKLLPLLLTFVLLVSAVSVPVAASTAGGAESASADGPPANVQTNETETATANDDGSGDADSFEVSLGSDRTLKIGEKPQFQAEVRGATGYTSYMWDHDIEGTYSRESDDGSAFYFDSVVVPGNYTVTVTATDDTGQSVSDTVNVTVTREFADAQSVESGETVSGDDIDGVYSFEAEKGEPLAVVSGGGMREAVLYDRDGQPIRTITRGPDTDMQGTTANYSGRYFVAITSYADEYAELTAYTRSQESSEPNQGPSDAAAVTDEATETGILTRSDDSDWYAVEAGEGDLNVSAELTVHALYQGDVGLQIYTADGRPVGTVEPFEGGQTNQTYAYGGGGTFEAEQSARITEPGTYYIRVARPETNGRYTAGFTEYDLTVNAPERTTEGTDSPNSTETVTETPTETNTSNSTETPTASTSTPTGDSTEAPTTSGSADSEPDPSSDSSSSDSSSSDSSSSDSSSSDSSSSDSSSSDSSSSDSSSSDSSSSDSSSSDSESNSVSDSSSSDSTDESTATPTATPTDTETPTSEAADASTSDSTPTATETSAPTETATSDSTTTTAADTVASDTPNASESSLARLIRDISSLFGRLFGG